MCAALVELKTRSRDSLAHGSGNPHRIGLRSLRDARADTGGDTGELTFAVPALTCVLNRSAK